MQEGPHNVSIPAWPCFYNPIFNAQPNSYFSCVDKIYVDLLWCSNLYIPISYQSELESYLWGSVQALQLF